MCYTSAGYWNANIYPSPSWKLYPLFVANWFVESPMLPRDWTTWKAHQYTNKGDGKTYGQERGSIDLSHWKPTPIQPPPQPPEIPAYGTASIEVRIGEYLYTGGTKITTTQEIDP